MAIASAADDASIALDRQDFDAFVTGLIEADYRVVAPILRDSVIVLDEIESPGEIPRGIVDAKSPGSYSVRQIGSSRRFAYTVGPDSAKRWLFPPEQTLWSGKRTGASMTVALDDVSPPKLALLGLRPCDLRAIQVLDRVLLGGPFQDRQYASRRERTLLIAVDCDQPAPTCFCDWFGSGPKADSGYDILLTENEEGFLVRLGTEKGRRALASAMPDRAIGEEPFPSEGDFDRKANGDGRRIGASDLKDMLYRRAESPRWKEIASRCLACGNCTLVCPTCFCTTIEDHSALDGSGCSRTRHWDSCFNVAFSYIHGGSVRQSAASRYRQWLTHKFAAWEEQFDSPGCVGCGRCIVWCPAGIDVTEELAAFRDEDDKSVTR